ncbi:hypothetical protein Syun_006658 [Stephania yunnanensis]|uniref:BHLH domain-containing protein n=1 Tax=Stephania yunnanensis TaxID=152371 RepID=A0AAP0KWY4_9MAGN
MGGEKGLTHLQDILRSLCFRTPWKYAVFWKLRRRDHVVLTWEEAYYANYGPVDPSDRIPSKRTFEYLDDRYYLPNPIGKAIVEMSCVVYSLGEGIIGQVASTGKHKWVFVDDKSLSHISSLHDCYEGWNSQFSAGISTIAIVPVVPYGVVQLGSPSMQIAEDVKLVNHIEDAFHSLQDCSTESITQNLFQYPMQSRLWSQVSLQQTGLEPFSDIPHSSNKVTSNISHFLPCPSSRLGIFHNLSSDALSLDDLHQSDAYGVCDKLFIFEPRKYAEDIDSNHNNAPASHISPVDNTYPYHSIWHFDERLDKGRNSAVSGIVKLDSTAQTPDRAKEPELPYEMILQLGKGSEYKPDRKITCIDGASYSLNYPVGCKLYKAFETAAKKEGYSPQDLLERSETVVLNETPVKLGSGYLTTMNGSGCHLGVVSMDVGTTSHNVKSRKSRCLSTESLLSTRKKSETSCLVKHYSSLDGGVLSYSSGIIGYGANHHLKSIGSTKEVIEEHSTGSLITIESNSNIRSKSHLEPAKVARKRSRPYQSRRPQPRNKQLIQNRIKELRDLVPNGSKCSISSLLEHAVEHMLFLQDVTKKPNKIEDSASSKFPRKHMGPENCGSHKHGSSMVVELENEEEACPIETKNLMNGQMLAELCEDSSTFRDVADALESFYHKRCNRSMQ